MKPIIPLAQCFTKLSIGIQTSPLTLGAKAFSCSSLYNNGNVEIPKKPMTPFFQYKSQELKVIRKQSPDKKVLEITGILADRWNQMSGEEKEVYQTRYLQDKAEYQKKIEQLEANPSTKVQLEIFKAEKVKKNREKAYAKALLSKRRLDKNLGRPKLPPSGWTLYFTEQMKGVTDGKLLDRTKSVAQSWKALDENEKLKYNTKAIKMREQYEADLEIWKQKMLNDDRTDDIEEAITKINQKRKILNKTN